MSPDKEPRIPEAQEKADQATSPEHAPNREEVARHLGEVSAQTQIEPTSPVGTPRRPISFAEIVGPERMAQYIKEDEANREKTQKMRLRSGAQARHARRINRIRRKSR